jgi:hypothetical protein
MVPLNDDVSLRDQIENLHRQIAYLQQRLSRAYTTVNIQLDKGK